MRQILRRAAVGCVALALPALVAEPLGAQAPPAPSGELFVQRASTGRLIPIPGKPGVFNLTLTVPGAVVGFTDRPARRVNNESLASFAARWQRRGFAADPPNAALVIDDAPASGDVVVVELLSRRLLSAGVIRYRVRTLAAPGARSPLARLARRADRGAQRTFGRASLYVDPSTGTLATIRLTIPALAANQIASLIFDDPYQVASTRTALSGTGMVETELNAVVVFAGSGGVSSTLSIINLSGGGATISGIAELPDGVSVTVQVIGPGSPGPAQTFSTSAFELTVPQ